MLHQDSASRALLVGTACDPMNPALMLVALVLAREWASARTTLAVRARAPVHSSPKMIRILVSEEVRKPSEAPVAMLYETMVSSITSPCTQVKSFILVP